MKCILDLDGVLVDFHIGWHNVYPEHKHKDPKGLWLLSELYGITYEESCERLNVDFWTSLPWMSDGKRILKLLESVIGQQNICIVTSNNVTDSISATIGKTRWINRELPKYASQFFIGTPKHFFAHSNTFLIDDKAENIDHFIKEKGHGFLLPRPWNRHHMRSQYAVADLVNFIMERN